MVHVPTSATSTLFPPVLILLSPPDEDTLHHHHDLHASSTTSFSTSSTFCANITPSSPSLLSSPLTHRGVRDPVPYDSNHLHPLDLHLLRPPIPIDLLSFGPNTMSPSVPLFNKQRTTPNPFSRSSSHHHLKYGRSRSPNYGLEPMCTDLNRVYTSSYLTDHEPMSQYLRKPVDVHPPKSPQFHRPHLSSRSGRSSSAKGERTNYPKQGMQAMVDHLIATTPRPKSPHMNNEEPIEMAHFPDARRPKPNEPARIERDDFPAPPYPYADPERRRRLSESSGRQSKEPDLRGDETDNRTDHEVRIDSDSEEETREPDPQLKKEEEELSKIATGIGKVFLKNVKEREKMRAWKLSHVDPRNSSRIASAKNEIPRRLRYDNPVNASPSRDMDRPKPWEEDDLEIGPVFRSSGGKSSHIPPSLNYNYHQGGHVTPSMRNVPKPGYIGGRTPTTTHTLIGGGGGRSTSPHFCSKLSKTHSIEFSSAKSDISARSELQMDSGLNGMSHQINHSMSQTFRGTTPFSEVGTGFGGCGYRNSSSYASHLRRSMPNVNFHLHTNEPAKQYPYHLLMTSNYRLPPNVDRCHLERHLSTEEFQNIFHMTRLEFYRAPEWKRNDIKKRVRLF